MQENLELKDDEHALLYSAQQSIRHHISGGNVLIVVTILAFIIANVPSISVYYFSFWNQEIRLQIGDFNLFSHGGHPMTVLQFINDALMAIFTELNIKPRKNMTKYEMKCFEEREENLLSSIKVPTFQRRI